MKTYSLEKNCCLFAFEIDNAYISLNKIEYLLGKDDGVSDIKRRRMFSSTSDVHIVFKYKGKSCMVWEPYGDSSRYWIGSEDDKVTFDISSVEQVFKNYELPLQRKLIGDVVTLNFKSLFNLSD
jgi:hypothetical protein